MDIVLLLCSEFSEMAMVRCWSALSSLLCEVGASLLTVERRDTSCMELCPLENYFWL